MALRLGECNRLLTKVIAEHYLWYVNSHALACFMKNQRRERRIRETRPDLLTSGRTRELPAFTNCDLDEDRAEEIPLRWPQLAQA